MSKAAPVLEWAERAAVTARSTTSETAAMNSDDRERTLARFWPKVNKTGESPGACWLWTGSLSTYRGAPSYGRFWVKVTTVRVHRFAYEALVGPIPSGLHLDHLCRVHNCVNPAHLEPVTNRENALRGVGPTAQNAAKTHCPKGHPYSGDNLYVYPRGHRECRECKRVRNRGYGARDARERALRASGGAR